MRRCHGGAGCNKARGDVSGSRDSSPHSPFFPAFIMPSSLPPTTLGSKYRPAPTRPFLHRPINKTHSHSEHPQSIFKNPPFPSPPLLLPSTSLIHELSFISLLSGQRQQHQSGAKIRIRRRTHHSGIGGFRHHIDMIRRIRNCNRTEIQLRK